MKMKSFLFHTSPHLPHTRQLGSPRNWSDHNEHRKFDTFLWRKHDFLHLTRNRCCRASHTLRADHVRVSVKTILLCAFSCDKNALIGWQDVLVKLTHLLRSFCFVAWEMFIASPKGKNGLLNSRKIKFHIRRRKKKQQHRNPLKCGKVYYIFLRQSPYRCKGAQNMPKLLLFSYYYFFIVNVYLCKFGVRSFFTFLTTPHLVNGVDWVRAARIYTS